MRQVNVRERIKIIKEETTVTCDICGAKTTTTSFNTSHLTWCKNSDIDVMLQVVEMWDGGDRIVHTDTSPDICGDCLIRFLKALDKSKKLRDLMRILPEGYKSDNETDKAVAEKMKAILQGDVT